MPWDDADKNKEAKNRPAKKFKGPWGERAGGRQSSEDPHRSGPEQDGRNPWGRGRRASPGGGNSIDDLVDMLQERIRKIVSGEGAGNNSGGSRGGNGFKGGIPKGSGKTGVLFAVVAFIIWLGTGLYRVQEGEVGVVLRFGEMVRTSVPGLQYHLPHPFESVIVQKVAALNTIESAMKSDRGGESVDTNLILTGDENMVHTNYTILWKIKDVSEYLFTTRDPDETIRVAAESVVREVIGQTTARLSLTEGRGEIEVRSQEILQKLLDQYKMGIQVVSIQLQNVAPPHQVVDAFNDLQASLVNADQSRNEAEAYRNEIIPRTEGEATQIENEATADSQRKVAEAEGKAQWFTQIQAACEEYPEATRESYWLETMNAVLADTGKIIMDEKAGKSMLPLLNVGQALSEKEALKKRAN